MNKSLVDDPTKPTLPSFVGFVGSAYSLFTELKGLYDLAWTIKNNWKSTGHIVSTAPNWWPKVIKVS